MPVSDPPGGAVSRRRLLAAAALAAAGGCAGGPPGRERIVDLATGREIDEAELLVQLRGCDVALLGELHDNPLHHRRRGALLAALGADSPVFAEHLPRGRRVQFGTDLKASLVDAGFDARAWDWPLHEPLFAAIARSGAPLAGANAPDALVRRVAREGHAALPAEYAAAIDAAPLAPAAQAALDADLVDGHCGHLGGTRLEAMRWAQRARDAAMALTLAEALAARRGAGRSAPVVLVAGNGHVRTDYGVAQLLARPLPAARCLAVAFLEHGAGLAQAPYTHAWLTAPVTREDPCAGLAARMQPGASAPR